MDLTPQQRAAQAQFDLFGLTMPRQGGKWVTVYLDDLEYTAREDRDGSHFPQVITQVKYPTGGRTY
jgi:hypothetical protein